MPSGHYSLEKSPHESVPHECLEVVVEYISVLCALVGSFRVESLSCIFVV